MSCSETSRLGGARYRTSNLSPYKCLFIHHLLSSKVTVIARHQIAGFISAFSRMPAGSNGGHWGLNRTPFLVGSCKTLVCPASHNTVRLSDGGPEIFNGILRSGKSPNPSRLLSETARLPLRIPLWQRKKLSSG